MDDSEARRAQNPAASTKASFRATGMLPSESDVAPPSATEPTTPMSMPMVGDVLNGKYRLVRELGAGGMGIVYEGEHLRLRQPFAIKILQPDLAREREFLIRFEREARAAAQLRSPHIVRVFDVDVAPEGLTYMVMELLEGCDLATEADKGVIAPAELVDWIIQACSALQEAHDNGIVHRDLKPANIFLTTAGDTTKERIAKVLDFGISKIDAMSTGMVTNRAAGVLGTPTYMAPEQIRNRRVDGRADVWALGVILYRVLGGRWPFSGRGDQGYMAAVLTDPAFPFELVRPDLPVELASVIMKTLEKTATDRYATASELARALAPFGTGRSPPIPVARGSRPSLPAPATPSKLPVEGGSSTRPARAAEREGPLAIVIPADAAAVASMVEETVPTPTASNDPLIAATLPMAPKTPGSPPATVYTPARTTSPSSSASVKSALLVVVFAGLAGALGFAIYMGITSTRTTIDVSRSAATPPTTEPLIVAPAPSPSASASALGTTSPLVPSAPPPPPLGSAETKPVGTPSSPRKRAPRPPPPSSAPTITPATPSTRDPDLPDHL